MRANSTNQQNSITEVMFTLKICEESYATLAHNFLSKINSLV